MTIDATKITPEKLAEMNDSLIVDNNHLRGRVVALTNALVLGQSFLYRVTHWEEGKPDLHDIKEVTNEALK